MLKKLWSLLTDPNYGLEKKQFIALQKTDREFQRVVNKMNRDLSKNSRMIDWQGVSYTKERMNESYDDLVSYICTHPEYIDSKGNFLNEIEVDGF